MTTVSQTDHQAVSPLNQLFARRYTLNWELIFWLVILLLAIFTRFYLLGDRVMSHDESLHTKFSYDLSSKGIFSHTPLMHGPILFHVTAFFYSIFGDNDFTSRIYPAALGVMVVMFPLLFRRWIGRWGAILAGVMLLISPLMMYYNRYIRHDTPSILYALVMAYCVLMYINGPEHLRRRSRWLYIFAAAMILNLGSKETSFIYIAIFGSFLTLFWVVRLAQHFWNIPGRKVFYFLIVGILLGGVGALGMYIIVDIIPAEIIPGRGTPFGQLSAVEQTQFVLWVMLVIGAMIAVAITTLFWVFRDRLNQINWSDLAVLLTIALVVCGALLIFEELSHTTVISDQPVAPADPNNPEAVTETNGAESRIRWWPMFLTWGVSVVVVAWAYYSRLGARNPFRRVDPDDEKRKTVERGQFWKWMERFPEFDILIVMGTLILPWLTALIPFLMRPSQSDYITLSQSVPEAVYNLLVNIPNVGSAQQVGQFILSAIAWLPLMTVAIAVGLAWNWKRWLIASAIFHVIFVFFFTTVFTNIAGLGTGMIYSLGYWLEQQGVRRGSQPQYYYLLIVMPFYEFLPVIGGVLAMFAGMIVFWRHNRRADEIRAEIQANLNAQQDETRADLNQDGVVTLDELMQAPDPALSEQIEQLVADEREHQRLIFIPFLLFIGWWAILNLVGYTLAGEKMPWLGTHLTTPLIILTAWVFGQIIERIDWQIFRRQGWMLALVLPVLWFSLFQVIWPYLSGQRPFAGLLQRDLEQTYEWLAALAISGGVIYVAYRIMQSTGWAHVRQLLAMSAFVVLAVITLRSAWIASFINFDYATEFLVYAHAAPAIKTVLDDIEEMSLKVSDGLNLRVAYDDRVPWPYSWYFREYTNVVYLGGNPTLQSLADAAVVIIGDSNRAKVEPLLEDRYYRFDHNRLWWPMQDYFYLTADRVLNFLDLSPENAAAARMRRGVFDIWWARDYTTYGEAVSKTYNVKDWPVSDRMHVYVRKDFAAQIWPYGVGEGTVANPLDQIAVNQCNSNWIGMQAVTVFEQPPVPLNRPLGLDVTNDGRLYVAEEFGHRVSIYDLEGRYLSSFGQQGDAALGAGFYTRPNSVEMDAEGSIYVVDTWNFRIQKLNQNGEMVAMWGSDGRFGPNAPRSPEDGFWGPRDVAVDSRGYVYVADTGNKRIRVYSLVQNTAVLQHDLGSSGSLPGQLEEPSSVVIGPDGRAFIADTWNRRISVFGADGGFLTTFNVRGWYEEQGNRPYLAVDGARSRLYVTDPDAGRVLVYDLDGNCVGSFGQVAGETYDNSQFRITGGIDVDEQGFVYVSDPGLGRILKFEPFPEPPAAVEIQPEVSVEVTEEINTLEVTEEAQAAE